MNEPKPNENERTIGERRFTPMVQTKKCFFFVLEICFRDTIFWWGFRGSSLVLFITNI